MDKSFSLLDFFLIFLRKKRRIFVHFLCISLLAVAVSYAIPKKYKATTLFLPPYDDAGSGSIALGLMLNVGRTSAFSPQQLESLLDSRRILEAVVREFDLIRVYKATKAPNPTEKTLKRLRNHINLQATTLSGLTQNVIVHYSLSVIDKDSLRAAKMANFMLAELNRAMDELSKDQYSYSESFVKGRLDSVTFQRSTMMDKLSEFQKTHKIYSPQIGEQVVASISTYAELHQQKLRSEIQRELMLFEKGARSREVLFEDRKLRELETRMRRLETNREAGFLPGLEHSIDLSQEYLALYQETEILAKLEIMLRQQYEEARIKSARLSPTVRVIDAAKPPEWKNSPKKALVVLTIVGLYMGGLLLFILLAHGLSMASPATRQKLAEFRTALRLRAG